MYLPAWIIIAFSIFALFLLLKVFSGKVGHFSKKIEEGSIKLVSDSKVFIASDFDELNLKVLFDHIRNLSLSYALLVPMVIAHELSLEMDSSFVGGMSSICLISFFVLFMGNMLSILRLTFKAKSWVQQIFGLMFSLGMLGTLAPVMTMTFDQGKSIANRYIEGPEFQCKILIQESLPQLKVISSEITLSEQRKEIDNAVESIKSLCAEFYQEPLKG
ncbi:hypothetical protein R50073_35640 [Maricurvus nonylphenolicus]|uniref:hypothetical protein n=1 Tax=Maricurvus nonylphenolicus TaxID=1008307 RepID=UPI0036F43DA0